MGTSRPTEVSAGHEVDGVFLHTKYKRALDGARPTKPRDHARGPFPEMGVFQLKDSKNKLRSQNGRCVRG